MVQLFLQRCAQQLHAEVESRSTFAKLRPTIFLHCMTASKHLVACNVVRKVAPCVWAFSQSEYHAKNELDVANFKLSVESNFVIALALLYYAF